MNESSKSNRYLLPAIVLGASLSLGVIAASAILSHGAQQVAAARDKITVKGTAEKPIKADKAQWTTYVTVRSDSIASGIPNLQKNVETVINSLTASNLIDRKDLQLADWNAEPIYQRLDNGYEGALIGYHLRRKIGIVLSDVNIPSQLNQRIEQLIQKGYSVSNGETQYLVSNLEQIKLSLIGEATQNAHDRAVEFAKSGGITVGTMQSASQGIFQIRAPLSTDESEYGGEYDTSTIDKIARVVVTVNYSLKN
ncbi:MAG: SIMPL domain-containing protein [Pseudomonadota bacterium]|nr:SIMPL domain-containing protein [Pseudomonadota bacterium]